MGDQSVPLIENNMLPQRFIDLLNVSTQVDIAVAWAGPCLPVEDLLEQAEDKRIRIAVGLSGNNTEPATLRRLLEVADLRVAPAPRGGIFHPKFYRFHGSERTVCWVGSPNLTRGGFGGNTELVKEFADTNDESGAWFEALWQGLEEDPRPAIAQYEEHYRPPKPLGYRGAALEWQGEFPKLQDLVTWEDFVAALHVLDDYCHQSPFDWDVLGETYSYLHTIGVGRQVARRGNWGDFNHRDRNILCGLTRSDDTGAWGLLGNLSAAGRVQSLHTTGGRRSLAPCPRANRPCAQSRRQRYRAGCARSRRGNQGITRIRSRHRHQVSCLGPSRPAGLNGWSGPRAFGGLCRDAAGSRLPGRKLRGFPAGAIRPALVQRTRAGRPPGA